MEAVVGLVGVVAGAIIALGGQWVQRRASEDKDARELLLEQCATVVGLEHEVRHLIWDSREGKPRIGCTSGRGQHVDRSKPGS